MTLFTTTPMKSVYGKSRYLPALKDIRILQTFPRPNDWIAYCFQFGRFGWNNIVWAFKIPIGTAITIFSEVK